MKWFSILIPLVCRNVIFSSCRLFVMFLLHPPTPTLLCNVLTAILLEWRGGGLAFLSPSTAEHSVSMIPQFETPVIRNKSFIHYLLQKQLVNGKNKRMRRLADVLNRPEMPKLKAWAYETSCGSDKSAGGAEARSISIGDNILRIC
jgi:hypothetical protein